tara:strand:+ start:875 stop:1315 length:441 start_codon:yes stop_codon:yes gene_type:complete
MVAGYDLRLNLTYFIDKSYEKEIMDKINEIALKYTGFNVRLFYTEDDNLTSKLKDFAKRYDGKVKFDIRISGTDYQQINDVAWYQIFSEDDGRRFSEQLPSSGRWRWNLKKVDKENLFRGIEHFESILMHISEPKVMKKQKRNDDI